MNAEIDVVSMKFVMLPANWRSEAYANYITFVFRDEDTNVIERELIMTRKIVDDLGWPEAITVTVERGDKLNA